MKSLAKISAGILAALAVTLASCHDVKEYADDPCGNFEALWTILDQHYCYFEQKDVDWDAVHTQYFRRVQSGMTSQELFDVCAEMLDLLRDGHTNLSAPFNTSYYRRWWSDYPQNFVERLIEEYYFNFNYRQVGTVTYGILPQNIGYVRIPSFSTPIGDGNIDWILSYVATCQGLVIDIRDNGGGDLTTVEQLCRRFVRSRTLAGYISHKTGPGHGEFSEPYAYYYDAAEEGRLTWGKPVAVLINRSTYSAANAFAAFMRTRPGVILVGATTGGGSGMPFSAELPNGWGIRFSGSPMLDADGRSTEAGVPPTDGYAVDLDPNAALAGHDTILDTAVAALLTLAAAP